MGNKLDFCPCPPWDKEKPQCGRSVCSCNCIVLGQNTSIETIEIKCSTITSKDKLDGKNEPYPDDNKTNLISKCYSCKKIFNCFSKENK